MRSLVVTVILLLAFSLVPAQECKTDIECVDRSQPMTAGLCSEFAESCHNKAAPWTPLIRGNLTSFCSAYVNGCSGASITLSRGGTKVDVLIDGPGAFEPEACTLEVSSESSSVSSGSAGRIADSVQACIHNAPVYFFKSMEAAEQGRNSCCGYPF